MAYPNIVNEELFVYNYIYVHNHYVSRLQIMYHKNIYYIYNVCTFIIIILHIICSRCLTISDANKIKASYKNRCV